MQHDSCQTFIEEFLEIFLLSVSTISKREGKLGIENSSPRRATSASKDDLRYGNANRWDNAIPVSDDNSPFSRSMLANASRKISRNSKTACLYSSGAAGGAMNSGVTAKRPIEGGQSGYCSNRNIVVKIQIIEWKWTFKYSCGK